MEKIFPIISKIQVFVNNKTHHYLLLLGKTKKKTKKKKTILDWYGLANFEIQSIIRKNLNLMVSVYPRNNLSKIKDGYMAHIINLDEY